MKHVLLIGVGPLPFYESDHLYGFGIRAWQFALPLLRAGNRITLITCEFGVTRESSVQIRYQTYPSVFGPLEHIPLPEPNARNMNVLLTRIEEIIRTHNPDVIVTAGSSISSNLAALLDTDLPIWMDMFGDLFAEVQAKSPFSRNDEEIDFFHRNLARVLLRGDRFSVVSEMQRGAAIGQLGLMGRLNRYTLGEEMVWTIPCAMNGAISPVKRRSILRGDKVGSSDFLLLCSGGFNTWADVDTLFSGIEGAMEKSNRVHCIVTGGQIKGHHEDGFNRFRTLIEKSPYERRFHLLGWVSNQDVTQITLECNLGLNIDLPIYESVLGSRNRMLYWMQCGLPILTTVTTEISRILEAHHLALCAPPGNAKIITSHILDALAHPHAMKKMALDAKRFAYYNLTFEETSQPLVRWVKNPVKASDNGERLIRNGQLFNQTDSFWHAWAFPESETIIDPTIPRPPKTLIRTRPQGKSWWRRLWGL
ncbi:MAG: hypothetical protein C4527_09650 [Candidatus Omnitrophota bacterium]|jgi:glycosyltransferase involved in cell wall biosynthesis|nr:MAG: hypothetical protein C4527_09650 [Candidatus Omnitrophota bacterium]